MDGRTVEHDAIARIAAGQQQDPVILVLPQRHCLVEELAVAAHERRYLARSLPWRFEEQVIAPVESLHFAMSAISNNAVQVTAVSCQWLQSVLADLAAVGILPQAALCESELLPWQAQAWSLWSDSGVGAVPAQCLVRFGRHRALLCSVNNLAAVLQALADEQAALPQRILMCCNKPEADALQAHLPLAMQGLVELRPRLREALPENFCNVLQGGFAPRLPWQQWWRQWRVAAALVLALLLADIALSAADLWRMQRQNEALRLAMVNTAMEVLPGAELADPLLQLRRAVAAMGGGDQSGILAILTRMSPVFAAASDIRVQSLEYNHDSGELQLVLESTGFTAVETLRARLQAQGLQAELLGSTSDGAQSRSRLRVKA
jgi:general secretion pathway protein L